ncbi:unnamed protein product [Rotaria sp. Silwood2]|nr:unnamed protein product [Rotaria sp. Silwood2]
MHQQRIATRLFLVLLTGSLLVLLLFSSIRKQTKSVTHHLPSYTTYERLQNEYPDTLNCYCSKITQSYSSFITLRPLFHPVCSSAFVTDRWFDQLKLTNTNSHGISINDWRIAALGYFQALATLCQLANSTVNDALRRLNDRSVVSSRLVTKALLHEEFNGTLNELIYNTQTEFGRILNVISLLNQVDQYFSGSTSNGELRLSNQTNDGHIEIKFKFSGPSPPSQFDQPCLCAFRPDCEWPMVLYENGAKIVPGFVWKCTAIDSILQSTLQYPIPPLNITTLLRFTSNDTVATIANSIFVEEWTPLVFYENYFHTCAPTICSYTYAKRANLLYILTTLISLYGGLTISLRLLAPLIVQFFVRRQRQQSVRSETHNERMPFIIRLRTHARALFGFIRIKITNLTFFPLHSFGSNVDRVMADRLNRLASRLYVGFLVVGLTILIMYTSIQERIVTKNILYPSMLKAQQIQNDYSNTAQCPCAKIAIPLDRFITVQPTFHQICSSVFVTDEWRNELTADLSNMSYYVKIGDYRGFISAHLQFVSGLCEQSIVQVNDAVRSFTSTSLVASQLLSETTFNTRLANLSSRAGANAPTIFVRAFQLVRNINHGNALMSIYRSNFEFVTRQNPIASLSTLMTHSMTYNETPNCLCGQESRCLNSAAFTSPVYVEIKGLYIGCLPSESLLASTFECFYDSDCIDLIRNHMFGNKTRTFALPLNHSNEFKSYYNPNTTINDIASQLFVEDWSMKTNYGLYFIECAPTNCFYSYTERANPFYVATTLLGLYGGLTVVLRWWSPRLVKLGRKVQIYYIRKRQNNITPITT